jgi:peroxiredoxin
VVWGIGSDDNLNNLTGFVNQMGLTFPVLFDEGGTVKDMYNPGEKFTNSVYPQDWIIGVDGTVVYVNTVYAPDEMFDVLDAEIAKMNGL